MFQRTGPHLRVFRALGLVSPRDGPGRKGSPRAADANRYRRHQSQSFCSARLPSSPSVAKALRSDSAASIAGGRFYSSPVPVSDNCTPHVPRGLGHRWPAPPPHARKEAGAETETEAALQQHPRARASPVLLPISDQPEPGAVAVRSDATDGRGREQQRPAQAKSHGEGDGRRPFKRTRTRPVGGASLRSTRVCWLERIGSLESAAVRRGRYIL